MPSRAHVEASRRRNRQRGIDQDWIRKLQAPMTREERAQMMAAARKHGYTAPKDPAA